MSTHALQGIVERIVAEHPDLWELFRVDPEAAIEAAGIELTPEEREAIRTAEQRLARGLKPADQARNHALGQSLKADLEAARRAQELARQRMLEELEAGRPAEAQEEQPGLLEEERRRRQDEAEQMRAALAEEQSRVKEERRRAQRLLGRPDHGTDKEKPR